MVEPVLDAVMGLLNGITIGGGGGGWFAPDVQVPAWGGWGDIEPIRGTLTAGGPADVVPTPLNLLSASGPSADPSAAGHGLNAPGSYDFGLSFDTGRIEQHTPNWVWLVSLLAGLGGGWGILVATRRRASTNNA
ncbi:hypothetical protein C731_4153 [Mycolicibacterium hassiacum DSM 44199]|uniref:Uncharacterized protein n=1 Tax=Mycolicibacterium hassiacum (strain DSM 44199 / CIP 105218 / JCM 12690 / 3849) TaxID=1122247 RepID=K5B7F1_MYCHD|nr:hypothetical protein [Mycolicibacterium hassiacum]EKF21838.1 hypothetical protein C731_4153 [Mycolicibacterium hassiacum DSM 44199]MDA4085498.1 hypothetical protein [Mycolicibacterium hassiacum DSM 44199]VCT92685.1 hypothetical protein MHAS_04415 [Mycolicibacterium hassiacum DSM 44199]